MQCAVGTEDKIQFAGAAMLTYQQLYMGTALSSSDSCICLSCCLWTSIVLNEWANSVECRSKRQEPGSPSNLTHVLAPLTTMHNIPAAAATKCQKHCCASLPLRAVSLSAADAGSAAE